METPRANLDKLRTYHASMDGFNANKDVAWKHEIGVAIDEIVTLRMKNQWLTEDVARLNLHLHGREQTLPTIAAGAVGRGDDHDGGV